MKKRFLSRFDLLYSFIFLYIKERETLSDNNYVTSKQSINDYFKQKLKKKAEIQYQQVESSDNQQTNSGENDLQRKITRIKD